MDDCSTYPPKPECGPTPQPAPTTTGTTETAEQTVPLPASGGDDWLFTVMVIAAVLFLVGYLLIRSYKD